MGDVELADSAELALASEYRDIKARLAERRTRIDRLRALVDHHEELARREEHALAEIEGVIGLAPQLQIEQLDRELGGKRLQEIAVSLLAKELQPGQAVHYREWYALVCRAGYRVRGKDPLASFLAQVSRSERVDPVGNRTGKYRLRAA